MDSKSDSRVTNLATCWQQFVEMQMRHEDIFQREILDVYKELIKNKKSNKGRKKNTKILTQKSAFISGQNLSAIPEEQPDNPGPSNPRTAQRIAAKKALEKTSEQLRQTLSEKLRNPESGSSLKKTNSEEIRPSAKRKLNVSEVSGSIDRGLKSESNDLKNNGCIIECMVVLDRCDGLISESEKKRFITKDCVSPIENRENGGTNKSQKSLDHKHSKSPKTSTNVTNFHLLKHKNTQDISCTDIFLHETISELRTSENIRKEIGSVKTSNSVEPQNSNQNESKKEVHSSPKGSSVKQPNSKLNDLSDPLGDRENSELHIPLVNESSGPINPISEVTLNINKEVEKYEFAVPASVRPTRIRTKNKKYDNDYSFTLNNTYTKEVSLNNLFDSKIDTNESVSNKSNTSKRGKKRKSKDDENVSNKSLKFDSEAKNKTKESSSSTIDTNIASSSSGKSSVQDCVPNIKSDDLLQKPDSGTESSSADIRCRTKILEKPSVKNIVVIDAEVAGESSSHQHEDNQETKKNNVIYPAIIRNSPPPEENQNKRMTRTRTKELNKNKAQMEKENSSSYNKLILELKNGKENKTGHNLKSALSSEKRLKTTPLASNNFIFSPSSGRSAYLNNKIIPLKVESIKKGGKCAKILPKDVAQERKIEFMKMKVEDNKRKREEKAQRALAHRQAVEKEQLEKNAKLQKENEERERLLAESKRQKEEQNLLKKQHAEMMLKEAEERRLKEEEAKQARLKKLEEDKKKAADLRLKQAEEAKRQFEMKLALEAKEKAKLKEAELAKMAKLNHNVNINSYELTPSRDEYVPKPPKNENDYGLSDNSDDSTDDEKQPKKIIPKWAKKQARSSQVMIQNLVHMKLLASYFPLVMDGVNNALSKFLGRRQRNSSAVWNTPDICN